MDGILSQQFSADWARVAMKQRFVALIGRSDKDRLAGDSAELQAGVANLIIYAQNTQSSLCLGPRFSCLHGPF